MKTKLKEKAIYLRRQGLTYSEILEEVAVARSTLSLWLRSVNLSEKQTQRITQKKLKAARKGYTLRKLRRIKKTKLIKEKAKKEIGKINLHDLWLMGIMLYWAEGSKEKENNIGQGVSFSNSDPLMTKIFIKWLNRCLQIKKDDIIFEIYTHESHRKKAQNLVNYWSGVTGFSKAKFGRIYLKKNKINTKRKNIGLDYHGLLRTKVKRSTDLNRKIAGWIEGVCIQCGVV